MPYEVGKHVGGYEVIELLGNARTGTSYKVRNLVGDRFEVLRILPRLGDREQTARFLREIRVHARLTHPNIVAFYNAMEIEGELVMTTELVDGITLAHRLEMGPLALNEAIRYACQALSAIGYAHERGIVHREISPENMLVTLDGTIKLSGFGMAKSASDPLLTQVGTVMGWLEYMSPEQVEAANVTPATDIYSMGAVLYEMVAGRVPFTGASQFDLMVAHVKKQPRPPLELNPAVSAELSSMILTALEKQPDRRFPSARAFRDALEGLLAPERPIPAVQPVPVAAPPQPSPPELTRFKLVLAAGATFLGVLAFLLLILKLAKL